LHFDDERTHGVRIAEASPGRDGGAAGVVTNAVVAVTVDDDATTRRSISRGRLPPPTQLLSTEDITCPLQAAAGRLLPLLVIPRSRRFIACDTRARRGQVGVDKSVDAMVVREVLLCDIQKRSESFPPKIQRTRHDGATTHGQLASTSSERYS
jgi:hypothetical protein